MAQQVIAFKPRYEPELEACKAELEKSEKAKEVRDAYEVEYPCDPSRYKPPTLNLYKGHFKETRPEVIEVSLGAFRPSAVVVMRRSRTASCRAGLTVNRVLLGQST